MSFRIWAELGPDSGAFVLFARQVNGDDVDFEPSRQGLKRACVIGKSLAISWLGQYHCPNFPGKPGTVFASLSQD